MQALLPKVDLMNIWSGHENLKSREECDGERGRKRLMSRKREQAVLPLGNAMRHAARTVVPRRR